MIAQTECRETIEKLNVIALGGLANRNLVTVKSKNMFVFDIMKIESFDFGFWHLFGQG